MSEGKKAAFLGTFIVCAVLFSEWVADTLYRLVF